MTFQPSTLTSDLDIQRLPARFSSDDRRVITLPFTPGGEGRMRAVVRRVSRLSEHEVDRTLAQTMHAFRNRHISLESTFIENYEKVAATLGTLNGLSRNRRLLIGSYFTMEYSVESAALFNPSICPHPDQKGVPDDAVRYIMSLRATGEGHLSSIVFRTGLIYRDGRVECDPVSRFSARARLAVDQSFVKPLFERKLHQMSVSRDAVEAVMQRLPDRFTFQQLEHAIDAACREQPDFSHQAETVESMRWLARSNYTLQLPPHTDPSEIVIFPQSETESRGIEDLRLVRFTEDDGSVNYYGTYTAYNGVTFLPQLLETEDFLRIQVHTLNGRCVQNKGMALFPRRIDGHYCMCGRIDGENLYIMYSDMLHFWESAEKLFAPKLPWEFMQIGNCGSPIETDAGWLLLTHGVGPMRQYGIGAMLLDKKNPMKVLGHLEQPLLMPNEEERDGYVPNVVYTCGAMVHGDRLYIPYAMSDLATSIASVALQPLLERLAG